MPFDEKPDPARKDRFLFDNVCADVIGPAITGLKKSRAGLTHKRMVTHIADADVAVVDITTANQNDHHELGARDALRDGVTVLLRRKGTKNSFNVGGMTTIEHDIDEQSAARAREAIAGFVAAGLLSGARDSLVYAVVRTGGHGIAAMDCGSPTRWRVDACGTGGGACAPRSRCCA